MRRASLLSGTHFRGRGDHVFRRFFSSRAGEYLDFLSQLLLLLCVIETRKKMFRFVFLHRLHASSWREPAYSLRFLPPPYSLTFYPRYTGWGPVYETTDV